MTNSWIATAERLEAQNEARRIAATEATASRAAEKNAKATANQLLEEAIAQATPSLAAFMNEHGDAAMRLLRARGNNAYVLFGVEQDGGLYSSVYLYEGGLGTENGCNELSVAYSKEPQKTPQTRAATPEQAVHFFAYYGFGRKDPEKVRTIVAWLTEEINKIEAIVKADP